MDEHLEKFVLEKKIITFISCYYPKFRKMDDEYNIALTKQIEINKIEEDNKSMKKKNKKPFSLEINQKYHDTKDMIRKERRIIGNIKRTRNRIFNRIIHDMRFFDLYRNKQAISYALQSLICCNHDSQREKIHTSALGEMFRRNRNYELLPNSHLLCKKSMEQLHHEYSMLRTIQLFARFF